MPTENDSDVPVWGAEAIGRIAGVLKDDGSVDLRRTFYLLESGYLDADKFGRRWASTPRRIRRRFTGESAT
jgi:hypothetical protein